MPRTTLAQQHAARRNAATPAAPPEAAPPAVTFAELRTLAKSLGLSAAGSRADIEARIQAAS